MTAQPPDEIRPRAGYILHMSGAHTPVRFVPTEDPSVFLAVTVDGEPIVVEAHAHFCVDIVGPGQSIQFRVSAGREDLM